MLYHKFLLNQKTVKIVSVSSKHIDCHNNHYNIFIESSLDHVSKVHVNNTLWEKMGEIESQQERVLINNKPVSKSFPALAWPKRGAKPSQKLLQDPANQPFNQIWDRLKPERVMAKTAEYGTAFLYGTAPQHCGSVATLFPTLRSTFYPNLKQIGQKNDRVIEWAPF